MGVLRKAAACLLSIAICLSIGMRPVSAQDTRGFTVEQAYSILPETQAYFYVPENISPEQETISAQLGEDPQQIIDLQPFTESQEGVCYLFLVDESTSVSYQQMDQIKRALSVFRQEHISEKDKFLLIGFGEQVNVLLDGSEDLVAAQEKINSLTRDQEGTLFFDAVKRAVELTQGFGEDYPQRKVAIAITDAVDFNVGGYTREEALSLVGSSNLPIYAVGLSSGAKDGLDTLGLLSRESGGAIEIASAQEISGKMDQLYSTIQNAWVLHLQAQNNLIKSSNQVLKITEKGTSAVAEKQITTEEWIPDTEPPVVMSVSKSADNAVLIQFSEPVQGAQQKEHFIVTSGQAETQLPIKQAVYQSDKNCALLTFENPIVTGEYQVSFTNITDISMEKNQVSGETAFHFEGVPAWKNTLHTIFFQFWWVIALFLLAILLLIVYLVIRKRKGLVVIDGKVSLGENVEYHHNFHTEKKKAPVLQMKVTDASGKAQLVRVPLDGSLFVGRSKICNLCFDDPRMSGQHFVLENAAGECFITDLESSNGTILNGVPVKQRRKLQVGDVITAGDVRLVYQGLQEE